MKKAKQEQSDRDLPQMVLAEKYRQRAIRFVMPDENESETSDSISYINWEENDWAGNLDSIISFIDVTSDYIQSPITSPPKSEEQISEPPMRTGDSFVGEYIKDAAPKEDDKVLSLTSAYAYTPGQYRSSKLNSELVTEHKWRQEWAAVFGADDNAENRASEFSLNSKITILKLAKRFRPQSNSMVMFQTSDILTPEKQPSVVERGSKYSVLGPFRKNIKEHVKTEGGPVSILRTSAVSSHHKHERNLSIPKIRDSKETSTAEISPPQIIKKAKKKKIKKSKPKPKPVQPKHKKY